MQSFVEYVPYILLFGWFIYSLYYIDKARREPTSINPYIFDSIPQVFPTIGILGTFLGIAYGLFFFDTRNMAESIPFLLDGLKTAFIASIFGIIGLLIFQKLTAHVQRKNEKDKQITSDELQALNLIIQELKDSSKTNNANTKQLLTSLVGETDYSISTKVVRLSNQLHTIGQLVERMHSALGNNPDTNILTQIENLRSEQNQYSKLTSDNSTLIVNTLNANNAIIKEQFENFAKLLTDNNTKALVTAIEKVLVDFNSQMNDLIQRLVKENFDELNNSVKRLNDWQKANKEHMELLIKQFDQVALNIGTTSEHIAEITQNTSLLTDENSALSEIVDELHKLLREDRSLLKTAEHLKEASSTMQVSSTQLAQHMKKEQSFQESLNRLIERLQSLESIKDTNKEFWKDINAKMNEGVTIISKANEKLAADVVVLDQQFHDRMQKSFMALDTVLQAMVVDYQQKTNEAIKRIGR
jgi:hypothetical protein